MSIRSVILAAALCALAPVTTAAQGLVVNSTFGSGGGSWADGTEILYRYNGVSIDGELYICGALSSRLSGGNSYRFAQALLREGQIELGGQSILRNLSFFAMVSNDNIATQLEGTTASCKGTGLPAAGLDLSTLDVVFRQGRYRIRG